MADFSRWNGLSGNSVEPDWRPLSNSDTIELGAGGASIGWTGNVIAAYLAGPHDDRGFAGPNAQDIADGWVFGKLPTTWPDNQPQWAENDWGIAVGAGVNGVPSGAIVQRWEIWYRWKRGTTSTGVPATVNIPPPDPTPILSSSDPTWGQVIPQSFGTRRVTGAPIWVGPVRRVAEHDFTGAVDFAVAFGTTARPADDSRLVQLRKLFAEGKLVYDASGGTPATLDGVTVTFYPGLENAQPDPTIKAAVGAGCPAYRGTFYAMIKNYPLFHSDTKLPSMRAELVDTPAFDAPTISPIAQLDPPRVINGASLVTDFDTGTVYAFSHITSEPQFLHSFDLLSGTELSATEINADVVNNNPGIDPGTFTYAATDWWTVFDKYNDLIHFQHGPSINNSMRIASMRADSGLVVSSYGVISNDLISDENSITFSEYADFVRFRAFGKVIHGLFIGTINKEAVVLTYRTADTQEVSVSNQVKLSYAGILKAGDQLQLGFDYKATPALNVKGVCAYPVLDRPELISQYGVDIADKQDGIFLYGSGTQVWCFQGNISGNDPTNTATASWIETQAPHAIFEFGDRTVGAIFVEKETGCICVMADDGAGNAKMVKLQPSWAKTGDTVTLTGVTELFEISLFTDVRLFGNMIKNENTAAGTFMYFGASNDIVVASLATGSEIYRHSVTFTLPDIAEYDSVGQTLFVLNTTTGAPVQLALFGSTSSLVPVTDFLKWCGLKLGYVSGDVTADVGITETVIGGNITTPTTAREAMITVAAMYGVASVEVGGSLNFVRPAPGDAATLTATFTRDDLSRMNESELQALSTTTMAANEMASDVSVGYLDPLNDYSDTVQTYKRVRFPFQTAKSKSTTAYSAPIVVNASDALTIAGRLVLTSYAEGTAFEYRLPHRFLNLSPGDVVGFLKTDNVTVEALSQALEITYNADWSMTVRGKRWSLSDTMPLASDTPAGRQPVTAQLPSDSVALVFDTTLVLPSDEVPGASLIYTGVGSLGQSWWKSAALDRVLDTVTSELYLSSDALPWGITSTALPATEAANVTFATDNDTVLTVSGRSLASNMFTSVSDANFRAGMNACFVGKPGAWELVYFRDVVALSENTFQLTGLLRGRRGTNVWCDGHAAGDTVMFVRSNGARVDFRGDRLDPRFRGKLLTYYAVGQNTRRAPAPNQFTFAGNSQRPWSVRGIKAVPASQVNAVNATSYSNECGQGDRRDLIGAVGFYDYSTFFGGVDLGSVPLSRGADYSVSNLLDGSTGTAANQVTCFATGQTAAQIVFDFHASGFRQIIDEITLVANNSTNVGTYDIDASDDAVTWTNLASGVNFTGSAGVHGFTNSTGYWFYRLNQTGGTTSDNVLLKEIQFKCMAKIEDVNDVLITWLRRDRLSPATVWVTDSQPMTEVAELYQVEIFPFSTTTDLSWPKVLPLVSGPRVVYSAADQTTHGFTPPVDFVGLRITQLGQGTDTANRLGLNNSSPSGIQVGATP